MPKAGTVTFYVHFTMFQPAPPLGYRHRKIRENFMHMNTSCYTVVPLMAVNLVLRNLMTDLLSVHQLASPRRNSEMVSK